MKNVSMRAWLHVVALALAGLPLLTLSTLASAQDSATVSSMQVQPAALRLQRYLLRG